MKKLFLVLALLPISAWPVGNVIPTTNYVAATGGTGTNLTLYGTFSGTLAGDGTAINSVTAWATNGLYTWYITPQQRGATGDGTTDDTAALQSWINDSVRSNMTAVLPPAPGGFYKITAPLTITNAICMVGMGGAFYRNTPATPCHIRQFTTNTDGFRVTVPADGLWIQRVAITCAVAGNQTNANCSGIAFVGGGQDSDCSVIRQVCTTNFGMGFYVASLANTTFQGCSAGFCQNGAIITNIANNVKFDSCSFGQNYVHSLWLKTSANVICDNCDFVDFLGQSVTNSGQRLTLTGCRFEDYTTNAPLAGSGTFNLNNTYFGDFSGAQRPSILGNTLHLVSWNSYFGCASNGIPIYDAGANGYPDVCVWPPVTMNIGFTNTAGLFRAGRASWSGGHPGPALPGLPGTIEIGYGLGADTADHAFWAYARLGNYGYGNAVTAIDLLGYAKDKQTSMQVAALNLPPVTYSTPSNVTLTVSSPNFVIHNGAYTITGIVLPDATSTNAHWFTICNDSAVSNPVDVKAQAGQFLYSSAGATAQLRLTNRYQTVTIVPNYASGWYVTGQN